MHEVGHVLRQVLRLAALRPKAHLFLVSREGIYLNFKFILEHLFEQQMCVS